MMVTISSTWASVLTLGVVCLGLSTGAPIEAQAGSVALGGATTRSSSSGTEPGLSVEFIPKVVLNNILINEVQFDPTGQDGGQEWIELFNSRFGPSRVSGILLKNSSGQILATLPDITLAPHSYLIVRLGPSVSDLIDLDFSDGAGTICTGQAAGDYLSNSSDGVYLQYGGDVYDAVFWGTLLPPTGVGYSHAVNSKKWSSGDYVELHYSSGELIFEGSTIGRDVDWNDTDLASDFMVGGGENSFGATQGQRNGMFAYSISEAIHATQGFVGDIFIALSAPGCADLVVDYAQHSNVVVTDPGLAGGYSMQANHSFDIVHNGQYKTLTGTITFVFERSGAVVGGYFETIVSGALATSDGSTGLVFTTRKKTSGFHTLSQLSENDVDYTWTENGQSYQCATQIDSAFSQLDEDTWESTESRTWTDWGGITDKTSVVTVIMDKLGDGSYHHLSSIVSTSPTPVPAFGQTQVLFGLEVVTQEEDVVSDNDFGSTRTISIQTNERYDLSGSLNATIELVEPASVVFVRTQGEPLSPLGTFVSTFTTKTRGGFPYPDPLDLGTDSNSQQVLNRYITTGGEFVESGTNSSAALGTRSFYIDAPTNFLKAGENCGCGCGSVADCSCGSVEDDDGEGLSAGDKLGIAAGVGVSGGACTAAVMALSPAGVTGVGVIAPVAAGAVCGFVGAVWWLFYEDW